MDYKTFKTKLSGVIRSAKTQRDNVQELIVAGLVHFEEHGDTVYLTELVRGIQGVKSLPTRTIQKYIQHHANVGWSKLKDKKSGFRKVGKEITVDMPDVTWYDWEGGDHNKVVHDYDALATIKTAITRAFNLEAEGKLKEGQHEKLEEIQAILDK